MLSEIVNINVDKTEKYFVYIKQIRQSMLKEFLKNIYLYIIHIILNKYIF